jgi:hypothetical protein
MLVKDFWVHQYSQFLQNLSWLNIYYKINSQFMLFTNSRASLGYSAGHGFVKFEGNCFRYGRCTGGGTICGKTGAACYGEDVEKAVKRASRFISAKQGNRVIGGRDQS